MLESFMASMCWSVLGLMVGLVLGYCIGWIHATHKKGHHMTTPERLRRRQIRNDWFIAILAVALFLGWVYFQRQDAQQDDCVNEYFAAQADTTKVRSQLVVDESQATRNFLTNATKARSKEEFGEQRAAYLRALRTIDRKREANPVREFPKGLCR